MPPRRKTTKKQEPIVAELNTPKTIFTDKIDLFKGLFVPVFTYFREDDKSLDLKPIKYFATFFKNKKMRGIIVNSMLGECGRLEVDERISNAEEWIRHAVINDLQVIVNVGGTPLPDVLEHARHAAKLGASGISCLPDLFYKPETIQNLIGYLKIVSNVCKQIPLFYYHCPHISKVNLDMEEFCMAATKSLSNFCGIFYASTDLDKGIKCLNKNRVIFMGPGTLLASAMLNGFQTAFPGCLNVRPELVYDIYKAMQEQDYAAAFANQEKLNNILSRHNIVYNVDGVYALKAWLDMEKNVEKMSGFNASVGRKFM